MWLSIDTQCMIFFETEYWDLTLLFKINVILLSITFLVLCCMLCLMGAVSLSLSPLFMMLCCMLCLIRAVSRE